MFANEIEWMEKLQIVPQIVLNLQISKEVQKFRLISDQEEYKATLIQNINQTLSLKKGQPQQVTGATMPYQLLNYDVAADIVTRNESFESVITPSLKKVYEEKRGIVFELDGEVSKWLVSTKTLKLCNAIYARNQEFLTAMSQGNTDHDK